MFPSSLFPLHSYSRCVGRIQKTCTVTVLELLSLSNLTVKRSTFLDCLLKHSLNQKNKLQKNKIFHLLQRRAEMHLTCSMARFVPRCLKQSQFWQAALVGHWHSTCLSATLFLPMLPKDICSSASKLLCKHGLPKQSNRAEEPVAGSPGLTLALVSGLSAHDLLSPSFLEISNPITRWSENSLLSGGTSSLCVYSKKEGSGIPIFKIIWNHYNSAVCTSKYQFSY